MVTPKKVVSFLEKNNIKHKVITHRVVYTAFDAAATMKVPEKMVVKLLVMRADKDFVFVLVSARKNVDLVKVKKVVNAARKKADKKAYKKLGFVKESAMIKTFGGRNKKGVAVCALASVYTVPNMVIDAALKKERTLYVPAGSFSEHILLSGSALAKTEPQALWATIGKAR